MKSCILRFLAMFLFALNGSAADAPLKVLVAGLVHGHVGRFLNLADPKVVTLVGVWEPDGAVYARYEHNPHLAGVPHYTDLEAAVGGSGAEAVWAFSNTRDHLEIVRAAAPHHLAVIVEKPLAVSWDAAREISALAQRNHSLVLTNYETSWYPAFEDIVQATAPGGLLGPIRQVYVQAGHEGPVKIQVQPEFLDWLRDPARGGGGALFDFGCYGANVVTWWLRNRPPTAVTAQTFTFDRVNYPHCDDHAVIELTYPDLQATITGSWHWTYPRKDAAVFGEKGAMITANPTDYELHLGRAPAQAITSSTPERAPIRWFAQTIRAGQDPAADPSSLANNLIVMRILEAARRSAAEHRTVSLAELPD